MLVFGLRKRGVGGTLASLLGAGLLAANLPPLADELIEAGTRRRQVGIRETLVFDRPISELFAFIANFEHFPEVVHGLEEVVDFDDGRSRWTIRTPTGRTVQWDAIVTKYLPHQVIAWESVPGAPVRASGLVRFRSLGPGQTRLDITIRYTPVTTSALEALAAMVGPSQSARLRTDLARAGGHPLRLAAGEDSY